MIYPKSSDDLSPMGLNLSKLHQSHAETEHDVFLTKIYPNVDIQLIHPVQKAMKILPCIKTLVNELSICSNISL